MLMLVATTLALGQGHSGSAKAHTTNQHRFISTTKQATSSEVAPTAGHFIYVTSSFKNVYNNTT